jgi:hypothetical protein
MEVFMKGLRNSFLLIFFILFFFSNKMVEGSTMQKQCSSPSIGSNSILVDISEFKLYLIERANNQIIKTYPIAGGKTSTPSPYGTWAIVYKDSRWGKGFGSRWMQLSVPWGTYGIHGTNKPLSISSPVSHGCIRMFNRDIEELYNLVDCGTPVVIYGGSYNLSWNTFRNLEPGDRGADVLEVQRKLRDSGYFLGELDGIYGETMKKEVIRYRKDQGLEFTHVIDKELYDALGIISFE